MSAVEAYTESYVANNPREAARQLVAIMKANMELRDAIEKLRTVHDWAKFKDPAFLEQERAEVFRSIGLDYA